MKIILGIMLVLVGCSTVPSIEREAASQKETPLPRIIDAHIHLEDAGEGTKETPSLKEFTENNVVGAVAHASRFHPLPTQKQPTQPIPIRICTAIVDGVTVAQVEKAIKEGKSSCMKVYLGYVYHYAYDKFYRQFYKLAEKLNVPVVFHTGDTYAKNGKLKYADPLTIDEVAVDFPKVKFLIAHVGNPWFESAAEVVYKNDNVYVDTSAILIGDINKLKPESVEELLVKKLHWAFLYIENPKKILFGTDWPLANLDGYIKAVKKAIPEESWNDVFFNNAKEFFKFTELDKSAQ
jgi:hypothetical protein